MPTKLKTVPAVRITCAWQRAAPNLEPHWMTSWSAGCAPGRGVSEWHEGVGPLSQGWLFCPFCDAPIVETVWTGPDATVSEKA